MVNPNYRQFLTTAEPAPFGAKAALSHDQTQVAYSFSRSARPSTSELWVASLDGTARRQLATGLTSGRYENYPIWSPDDRYLAAMRHEYATPPQVNPFPYTQIISMIEVETGQETPLVRVTIPNIEVEIGRQVAPIEWSLDGRHLYFWKGTGGPYELWQVDVMTLEHEYVATIPGQGVPACHYLSPDGQWVLCMILETRDPQQYAVIRVPTRLGQAETVVHGAREPLYGPIWHPNSQEVTINLPPQANEQAQLQVINVRSHNPRTLAVAETGFLIPRSWSPDGQWLVVERTSENPRNLFVISYQGLPITRITTGGSLGVVGWLGDDWPAQVQ